MLRAILFGFHGVLVDDKPIHAELFRQILAEEGLELTPQDDSANYLGMEDREVFAAVLEAAGQEATPASLSRLTARKSAYYQLRVRQQGFPPSPGAIELIDAASDRGWMLGVVTSALPDEVESTLGRLGVRKSFKVLVTARDVRGSKGGTQRYRRGLQLLNALPPLPPRLLHPHEVLAIEDSPAGLDAAASNGLMTLGVAHTFPKEQLEPADRVVTSLAEVDLPALQEMFASRR